VVSKEAVLPDITVRQDFQLRKGPALLYDGDIMKYGESLFDIFYLLTAILLGVLILKKAQDRTEKRMGAAVLILGCGDAFHLIPRILNYFIDADLTMALGVGKLVTSITMTVFYVIVYHIGCSYYRIEEQKAKRSAVYILAAARIILCLFPQNGWFTNESNMLWGILRNIPFVILGILVIILFYQHRMQTKQFRNIWLWILLSFAFYIPVAIFAGSLPILGMLMLPKTVCYLVLVFTFYKAVGNKAGESA